MKPDIDALRTRAEQGDASAQGLLGAMLAEGRFLRSTAGRARRDCPTCRRWSGDAQYNPEGLSALLNHYGPR